MSFQARYTDEERTAAVDLFVELVQSGMTRKAAGAVVPDRLGPSRMTVTNWAQKDNALLPPTHQDVQELRKQNADLLRTVERLTARKRNGS